MKNTLKICEIFESIQGEGRYQGTPAIFVRLSGCTRNCSFCDSKYHIISKELTLDQIVKEIDSSKASTVIFTGGEPLVQWKQLYKFLIAFCKYSTKVYPLKIHLETNGDLIKDVKFFKKLLSCFDYICISPKEPKVAEKVYDILFKIKTKDCTFSKRSVDIKVVTDLENVGKGMLQYATTLMPLTTYTKRDKEIRQKVWNFCVKQCLIYSARLHVDIWGKKRKI
jgi:7-carboxy-7-deazaguanine synthase